MTAKLYTHLLLHIYLCCWLLQVTEKQFRSFLTRCAGESQTLALSGPEMAALMTALDPSCTGSINHVKFFDKVRLAR